jgi:hypothetical protein
MRTFCVAVSKENGGSGGLSIGSSLTGARSVTTLLAT